MRHPCSQHQAATQSPSCKIVLTEQFRARILVRKNKNDHGQIDTFFLLNHSRQKSRQPLARHKKRLHKAGALLR